MINLYLGFRDYPYHKHYTDAARSSRHFVHLLSHDVLREFNYNWCKVSRHMQKLLALAKGRW